MMAADDSAESIPIDDNTPPAQPLGELFATELQQLHAYLHGVNPELVPAELNAAAVWAIIRKHADKFTPEIIKLLQDSLEGAKPQDFLDPETWKGLWFVLNYQLQEQAEPLKERLQKLPGGSFLRDVAGSLDGAKPQDFLNPETWKGLLFVVSYQLQAQAEALRNQLRDDDE